jgi:hypothetical protein
VLYINLTNCIVICSPILIYICMFAMVLESHTRNVRNRGWVWSDVFVEWPAAGSALTKYSRWPLFPGLLGWSLQPPFYTQTSGYAIQTTHNRNIPSTKRTLNNTLAPTLCRILHAACLQNLQRKVLEFLAAHRLQLLCRRAWWV